MDSSNFTKGIQCREYYFEYKITPVLKNGDISAPKIYFERDYTTPELPYKMFIVPSEWLCRTDILDKESKGTGNADLSVLPYTRIDIVYDIKGIDCVPLTKKDSIEYSKAEFKKSYDLSEKANDLRIFYDKGCKIEVTQADQSTDKSGIGVISMYKDEKEVARFYFSVNFSFRKKIKYRLKASNNTINLDFYCSDRPVGIQIKIARAKGRLPCLKTDSLWEDVIDLDFTKGPKFSYKFKYDDSITEDTFSIRLADENTGNSISKMTKFYTLECIENNTLKIKKSAPLKFQQTVTCPFCHNTISVKASSKLYKKGGVSCQNRSINEPVIFEAGKLAKKCLYCYADLEDESYFNSARILPDDYLGHNTFKIAFTGSPGAGKTTYISRFFDIYPQGDTVQFGMTQIKNSLKLFGQNVQNAPIMNLERPDKTKDEKENLDNRKIYNVGTQEWKDFARDEAYKDRAISIYPNKFPKRTTTSEGSNILESNPFIVQINKDSYISFYDVAGEDATKSNIFKNVLKGTDDHAGTKGAIPPVGVFCIINYSAGKNDETILNSLNKVPEDVPIAIILSKFDVLEKRFDSSSRCLTSDYFIHSAKRYTDSALEWEIDYSSKEIESYLAENGRAINLKNHKNVRFFGVASFNFNDSIHEDDENINSPGKNVRFSCSAKRIELPFLWMLKQFGVIE